MQDVQAAAEEQRRELRAEEQVTREIIKIKCQRVETRERSVVDWPEIRRMMKRANLQIQRHNLQMLTRSCQRVRIQTKRCAFRERLLTLDVLPHERGPSMESCIIHTVRGVVIVYAEEVVPAITRRGQPRTESSPRTEYQR